MFTKSLLFLLGFVGMFAVLFALIPGEFFAVSIDSSAGIPLEVVELFTVSNVSVYDTGGQDNMTYEYSSLSNTPPDWNVSGTSDDFLEVNWSLVAAGAKTLQLLHATQHTFPWTWYTSHYMNLYDVNRERIGGAILTVIQRQTLIDEWDSDANASFFYARCDHLDASIGFTIHNNSRDATIGAAWDNNEIDYSLSYEWNFNASSINAATLLLQLLTFQNPDLGVPGDFGTVLNLSIAIPFTVIVIVAIIKLIQSVIPTIRGVDD